MMNVSTTLPARLAIAALSLSAAVAVYCLAREYPPVLLAPLRATWSALAAHPAVFACLPSLFFTLAMGLLIGACAATPAGARLHCTLWIALALLLELTQHPVIAGPASGWLAAFLGDSLWRLIGPYWMRGTFDPADLFATLAGGSIALLLLAKPHKEHEHEAIR
jgi:hypothetical protein